jgi:hypothetical protein
MACNGVRISWLTWARKSVLAALAASAASRAATRRRSASRSRVRPRQRQRQRNRTTAAIAPDHLKRAKGRLGLAGPAQGFEPCGRLGVALGREQHEHALARDLVLVVAEQPLGRLVQRQDAAGGVERDRAVGRPVEHRLQIASRAVAHRRLAFGRAQPRLQFRFRRAAQRDQRRRGVVPRDRLSAAVDRQDLPVRPHDRDRARIVIRHPLRIAVAEHRGKPARRLKFREIAIADEIEERPVGIESARVADDENADRQAVENGAGVAPHLLAVGAAGSGRLSLLSNRRPGGRDDPQFCPSARILVAGNRRPADQGARDLAKGVALAAGELDALGGRAVRRLAGAQSVERARADRNDVRRRRKRGLAQDINLGRALGEVRLGDVRRRGVGLARLGRRSGFGSVRLGRRETHFQWFRGAVGSLALGLSLVGSRRAGCIDRRRLRGSSVFRQRQVGMVRSGVDFLAEDAKAAIAQKFPLAAEQRRSRKRDQPPPIRARKRPADGDRGKSLPSGEGADELVAAVEFGAAEQGLDGLAAVRRVGADRGGKHRMCRAKPPIFVKRPQEARIRRRRSAHIRRRRFFELRSGAVVGERGRLGARGAQRRNRGQKPRRAPRRGDASAAQIEVHRPPPDDETHTLEPRRLAEGKRRRKMTQAPRGRSLAPQQSGFERVRIVDPEQSEHCRARIDDAGRREHDRQPRFVAEPVCRRQPQVESRAGLLTRLGRKFRGRRRRRMGQSRRS